MGYGPLVRATTGVTCLWTSPAAPQGSFFDATTVFPDHVSARITATAALAALIGRERTGTGAHVLISQAEVAVNQLATAFVTAQARAGQLPVAGDVSAHMVCPCAGDDEWCVVSLRDDADRAALATVTGGIELSEWTRARDKSDVAHALQAAGVPAAPMNRAADVLADPVIEVHRGEPIIATNDNWNDGSNVAEMNAVTKQIGAAALETNDTQSSALLLDLQPGAYTFIARGKNDASGIVLLEVFDADASVDGAKLVNIATRAYSKAGDGVTIGGFVISGSAPKQILLRALGPTLTKFGIGEADVLTDPTIELHDASHGNVIVATNDNWGDNANAAPIGLVATRIGASPIDPTDAKSAALLLTLDPGVYTFVASGKANSSGVVLVEIYDAD